MRAESPHLFNDRYAFSLEAIFIPLLVLLFPLRWNNGLYILYLGFILYF